MKISARIILFTLLIFCVGMPVFFLVHGAGYAVYVANSSAGGNTGADCADAKAISYANTSGSYSSSPSFPQIGPGVTVHICGTISGGSNANPALEPAGSGASGNPIIFQSDSSSPATFTATYWGATEGAIYCADQQYITFDGNNNGTIENTAAPHAPNANQVTEAMEDDCSNSVVENWTVGPIYVHVTGVSTDCASAENCADSEGIAVNNADEVLVTNNIVHDVRVAIGMNLPSGATYTKWEVSFNTIYNSEHGTTLASSVTTASIASILDHDNQIYNGSNWDSVFTPGDCDWHHDAIHIFAQGGTGDVLNGVQIYNNYLHGLWTVTNTGANAGCFNAHIYFEGALHSPLVYNNVMELDAGALNAPDGGYLSIRAETGGTTPGVYNNTFYVNQASTSGPGSVLQMVDNPNMTIENNLISNMGSAIIDVEGNNPILADYNLYYTACSSCFVFVGSGSQSFSNWQGSGFDTHGQNGNNPNLSGTYTLLTGSAAIENGQNLHSLSIIALDSDKAGTARPSSGTCATLGTSTCWDQGAYQFGSAPPAPTATGTIGNGAGLLNGAHIQ